MIKTLLSVFGTKTTFYAMLATAVVIAGMFGYIRYQHAQMGKQKVELSQAREETKVRDERIAAMNHENDLFLSRIRDVNAALGRFQTFVATNTRQRQTDYESMIAPPQQSGQQRDMTAIEERANQMNGVFDNVNNMTALGEKK